MLFDMHLHQGCLEVPHLDDLAERIPALQDGDLRALTGMAARGGPWPGSPGVGGDGTAGPAKAGEGTR